MQLEHQVCSLELSRKLKELGVPQKSLFYWNLWNGQMDDFLYQIHYGKPVKRLDGVLSEDTCSAYTVAELGEMLPSELNNRGWENWENRFETYVVGGHWVCSYQAGDMMATRTKAVTEADARAKMLLYLLENNLITL